jgi:hypothetical protein
LTLGRPPNPEARESLLELLYGALHSPFGGIITTDNVVRLERKLRELRDGDPLLKGIEFRNSPTNPNEIWLVKRDF